MSRSILFLDLATVTGWAEGEPGGRATAGRVRLGAGGDPGAICMAFNAFLAPRLAAFRPARVIYEMPFLAGIKNANTVMITWGLAFVTVGLCKHYGVRAQDANLNTIRKHVLGTVPRGKGVDVKGIVMNHVRGLGYEPEDDNVADAICGWLYACAVLDPGSAARTSPLFAQT
ncbi:Holliday junction resolvase [Microcystis phage Mae-JY30]